MFSDTVPPSVHFPTTEGLKAYRAKYAGSRDYIAADAHYSARGNVKKEAQQDEIDWDEEERALQDFLDRGESGRRATADSNASAEYITKLLKCGFNVCVHGVGSKRALLRAVAQEWHAQAPVLEVQAFLPSLQFRSIIQNMALIVSKLAGEDIGSRRTENQLAYIEQKVSSEDFARVPVVALLVVHNIDGRALRGRDTVQQLSRMLTAGGGRIKCVASIDNFRSGFSLPRFCFVCAHTDAPYTEEVKALFSGSQTRRDNEEGLRYIMLSLTDAQKHLVKMVAQHTLAAVQQKSNGGTSTSSPAVSLSELWEMCLEEAIFTNKSNLELSLLEIIDHKVFLVDEARKYSMAHYSAKTLQRVVDNTLHEGGAENRSKGRRRARSEDLGDNNKHSEESIFQEEEDNNEPDSEDGNR